VFNCRLISHIANIFRGRDYATLPLLAAPGVTAGVITYVCICIMCQPHTDEMEIQRHRVSHWLLVTWVYVTGVPVPPPNRSRCCFRGFLVFLSFFLSLFLSYTAHSPGVARVAVSMGWMNVPRPMWCCCLRLPVCTWHGSGRSLLYTPQAFPSGSISSFSSFSVLLSYSSTQNIGFTRPAHNSTPSPPRPAQ